jgi:hypothetical protein
MKGSTCSGARLLVLVSLLCLLSVAGPAGAAQPSGSGGSLGRPSAASPQGTTTPLRPTLSWTKVSGASSYDIQILRGRELTRFFYGHTGTSRHLLNPLPANVVLTWRVRARAGGSTGSWSAGKKFIVSPPPPITPSRTITSSTPEFQWGKLRGATTYDCVVLGTGARLVKSGLTAQAWRFGRALPTNTPLVWRVRGRNADGKGVWSRDVTFKVVPDAPSLTIAANDRSKTYGHALALGHSAFTTTGLRPGDSVSSVTLSSAGAGTSAGVRGSPYAIVPSDASGSGLGKYAITYVGGSLTVGRRALTVGGVVAEDKSYDGATAAAVDFAGASLSGVIDGDVVRIDSSACSASFGSASVGVAKPVTVSGVTLRGADAGNYTVGQPAGLHADITARRLTIVGAVAGDKFYDGTAATTVDYSGAGLRGVIGADVVSIRSSGSSADFDSASVGAGKPVTVRGVTLGGADAGNYTVSQPGGLTADIVLPITAVNSSTAPLQGRASSASCFIPSGTAAGDLVFAVVQAQDRWSPIPPLGPTVGDWTKIGDYSYAAAISGTTRYFYHALYYLHVGASVPWHDVWDFFPAYLDNISVTNTTYRGATLDAASNVPYTTADTSLTAGSVTPAGGGEGLLFVGGAYGASGPDTVSVSVAPAGFTTDVNVSSNEFLGYFALANDPQTTAAATGAKSATLTTSTGLKHAWLVTLKP